MYNINSKNYFNESSWQSKWMRPLKKQILKHWQDLSVKKVRDVQSNIQNNCKNFTFNHWWHIDPALILPGTTNDTAASSKDIHVLQRTFYNFFPNSINVYQSKGTKGLHSSQQSPQIICILIFCKGSHSPLKALLRVPVIKW